MSDQELLVLEDLSYAAEIARQVGRLMARAHVGAECMVEQIKPLCHAGGILPSTREICSGTIRDLRRMAVLARGIERKHRPFAIWSRMHPNPDASASSVGVLDAARHAIAWINERELEVKLALSAWAERLSDPAHPLAGWEGSACVEVVFWFQLEPLPEHAVFDELMEAVHFKLSTLLVQLRGEGKGSWGLGGGYEWNDLLGTDHPLHSVHMGQLAYCFLRECGLPWQLLGRVRSMEAQFGMRASWPMRRGT